MLLWYLRSIVESLAAVGLTVLSVDETGTGELTIRVTDSPAGIPSEPSSVSTGGQP